jgi:hypothetical protein
VARVLKRRPFDLIDGPEPWLDDEVHDFIVSSVQKQRLCLDLVRILPALPIFEYSNGIEFRMALPVETSVRRPVTFF